MFFIYGINAIIPEKFTGIRLIGITAGNTGADAMRHIEDYCNERDFLLSSVTIEPMGDEETIDAETVADAIALFADDWLPDWAEEERDRYIGCTYDQDVPYYEEIKVKERPDYSVLNSDGTYKDGLEFNEPMLLHPKDSHYVVLVYHNPDSFSGDQFVTEVVHKEDYLDLWEEIMESPLHEGETTEDQFKEFSSELASCSAQCLADADNKLDKVSYCIAKEDWCDEEALWFCEFNARQVAKEIREEIYEEEEEEEITNDEDDGFITLEGFQEWYKNLYKKATEDWEDTDEDPDDEDDEI